MKGKRSVKLNKKHSEGSSGENNLASFLLNKHQKEGERGERSAQTALVLETILSGSDQQLQTILESWVYQKQQQDQTEQIEGMVRGWGPSSTATLFTRLLSLMGANIQTWTFPWIAAILKFNLALPMQLMGQINASLTNETSAPLREVLKLQGKLELFDI